VSPPDARRRQDAGFGEYLPTFYKDILRIAIKTTPKKKEREESISMLALTGSSLLA